MATDSNTYCKSWGSLHFMFMFDVIIFVVICVNDVNGMSRYVLQDTPIQATIQSALRKTLYAQTEAQCLYACKRTAGCASVLYEEKDCYRNNSVSYTGTRSYTLSGKTCMPWGDIFSALDNFFVDGSAVRAKNYCRDPLNKGYPWCLRLEDAQPEPCDIPKCGTEYVSQGCIVNNNVWGYMGRNNRGSDPSVHCQSWSSTWPHNPNFKDDNMFPDGSAAAAQNFCRDPSNSGYNWCYTTDLFLRFTSCNTMDCRDVKVMHECFSPLAKDYTGGWRTTITGRTCQVWSSQTPHAHSITASMLPDSNLGSASNYCRDPVGRGYLWCYTTDPEKEWEPCPLAKCTPKHIPCYPNPSASLYGGDWTKTYYGQSCQRWDVQSPYSHPYTDPNDFESEVNIWNARNFCRDPGGNFGHLVCYPNVRVPQHSGPVPCDMPKCIPGEKATHNCKVYATIAPIPPLPVARTGFRYYVLAN